MAKAPNSVYIPLETISEGGGVPASRLSDPMAAQVIVQRLIEANQGRSKTDGEVTIVPGWPSRGPLIPFFAAAPPPGPVVSLRPAEILPSCGAAYMT